MLELETSACPDLNTSWIASLGEAAGSLPWRRV